MITNEKLKQLEGWNVGNGGLSERSADELIRAVKYLIGEVERLSKCQSCGGVGYVELSHDPYMTSPCECVVFEQAVEDYPKLKMRNQELQKALEWYADPFNYETILETNDPELFQGKQVVSDKGKRAKQALKGIDTK